jgi:hypothetical protein
LDYDERAPVFVTAGAKFRIPAAEAELLQVNSTEQNDMMDARFQYFFFPRTLTAREKVDVPSCASCFSKWVCSDGDVGPPPPSTAVTTVARHHGALPAAVMCRATLSGQHGPAIEARAPIAGVWPPQHAAVPPVGNEGMPFPDGHVVTAVEAILDWMETHGGAICLSGPYSNVPALADSLGWSQNFFPRVGRLVPFLKRHGTASVESGVLHGIVC